MRLLPCSSLHILAGCVLAGAANAAVVHTTYAEAELIADRTAIQPGRSLTVALRLKAAPGWHTYWRNPGDAGLPTKLDWTLPRGFKAGEIQWPYPARLPAASLVNYGYEAEVLLPVEIQTPTQLGGETTFVLGAKADWLVCSDENCVPEKAILELKLPAGLGRDSIHAPALAQARANVPLPAATLTQWRFKVIQGSGGPAIEMTSTPANTLTDLSFFPYEAGQIENSAPQLLERTATGYRLQLTAAQQPVGTFDHLRGVLVATPRFEKRAAPTAVEIDLPLTRSKTGKQP